MQVQKSESLGVVFQWGGYNTNQIEHTHVAVGLPNTVDLLDGFAGNGNAWKEKMAPRTRPWDEQCTAVYKLWL